MNKIAELQKTVTENVIAALKGEGGKPWVKPWVNSDEPPIPYNFKTGQSYKGANILILWGNAEVKAYTRNGWLTFKQARELGGSVKKGEKSIQCIYYKIVEKKTEVVKKEKENYLMAKTFNLFNMDQIEGIDFDSESVVTEHDGAEVNNILNAMVDKTGLSFVQRGNRACYRHDSDRLEMPLGSFFSDDDYKATLAHELIHSTGSKSRLDRFSKTKKAFSDDPKKQYGFEEIVAELGAYFISAQYGFSGSHLQHESYIASWLKALENDHTYIFRAASAASKAVDYLNKVVTDDFVVDDDVEEAA